MQDTRRHILDILKERGQSTVDDIVAELQKRRGNITAVTVRHHLTKLQEDHLITTPELKHRSAPGRPQHVYMITEEAREHFPNNYQPLVTRLLEQLGEKLPQNQVNVIFEGVADQMAAEACIIADSLPERLDQVVVYLNDHGYNAHWEVHLDGYVLRTINCPYHHISEKNPALCEMDMRLIASLLGVVPRLMERIATGDSSCAYLIPNSNR